MTGDVDYCHTWNRRRMRAGVPLTAAEARARHDAGEQYIAVLPGLPIVLVTVDGANGAIAVTFFDDLDRQELKYWFREASGARMFLRDVTTWEYPDTERGLGLSRSSKIEDVTFHEDGYVLRVVRDSVERSQTRHEYRDVPVSPNWEPVPEFGDYTSIARRERPAPGQS